VWDWMGEAAGWAAAMPLRSTCSAIPASAPWRSRAIGPVTHVDASKKAVTQARANAVGASKDCPGAWIVDDAAKFAAREVRRERRYDGIISIRPVRARAGRRSPGGWRGTAAALIADCARLLDAQSRFLFLTVYAVRMSSLALAGLLAEALAGLPGTIEHGDLAIKEEGESGRILPTAIFARWSDPGAEENLRLACTGQGPAPEARPVNQSLILEVANIETQMSSPGFTRKRLAGRSPCASRSAPPLRHRIATRRIAR